MSLARDASSHWRGTETLRLFVSPVDKANLTVSNFKPGCYKLTEAGRCQIQLDDGFAAKPETCRLFPFNALKLLGEYLVVEPHPHLCPIALSSSHSPLSDHSELIDSMRADGIRQDIGLARVPQQPVGAVIGLEQAIRNLSCGTGETVETFVASQLLLSAEALNLPSPANLQEAQATVARFGSHLRRALGCWPTASYETSRQIIDVVLAVTPTLRSQLLFPPTSSGVPSLPLPMIRLPYFILAIYKLLALAAQAGMSNITYQTVMGVADRYQFLLRFCAWADEPMMWRSSRGQIYRRKGETREAYGRYVRAAKMLGSSDRSMVIADVLSVISGSEELGKLDRLERLCRRLSRSIEPRSNGTGLRRPSLGGWLLRNASEDALWRFAAPKRTKP